MTFNQSCYGIRNSTGHGNQYVYYALKNVVALLQQNAHGSVFDTITRETFKSAIITVPPENMSQKFVELVTPLLEHIKSNVRESKTLTELRDTLLPKLISGELDVSDIDIELPDDLPVAQDRLLDKEP